MPPTANDYVIQTANLTKVFRDFWRRPKVRAEAKERPDPDRLHFPQILLDAGGKPLDQPHLVQG